MSRCLASGAASAHRYNLASSTTIFKTRMRPCGIAVRAAIEKLLNSNEKRLDFGANCTSLMAAPRRIRSFDPVIVRCADDCQLKPADLQRSCTLRFPYGTGRSHSNGLLEQMPRSRDRRASARRALTATSPLRPTIIPPPSLSYALAKSKPY